MWGHHTLLGSHQLTDAEVSGGHPVSGHPDGTVPRCLPRWVVLAPCPRQPSLAASLSLHPFSSFLGSNLQYTFAFQTAQWSRRPPGLAMGFHELTGWPSSKQQYEPAGGAELYRGGTDSGFETATQAVKGHGVAGVQPPSMKMSSGWSSPGMGLRWGQQRECRKMLRLWML